MNKREINTVLLKTAQGDNDAFERLYTETRKGVYAFLYSYFNNRADCEDAVQTVYLKIKQSISSYRPGSNGLAWILQIAKNTALNELRASAHREKQLSEFPVREELPPDGIELKTSLSSVMKQVLDEEEQRILILHILWGYKHKEIAQLIGCPIGTVTSKYKRAADKMKKAWKEEQS